MEESTSYQYILQQGRQEGRQEGELQALRDTLLDVLSERFSLLPVELMAQIALAADPVALRNAIRTATKVGGLADFRFNA